MFVNDACCFLTSYASSSPTYVEQEIPTPASGRGSKRIVPGGSLLSLWTDKRTRLDELGTERG